MTMDDETIRFAYRHAYYRVKERQPVGATEEDIWDLVQHVMYYVARYWERNYDPTKSKPTTYAARLVDRQISNACCWHYRQHQRIIMHPDADVGMTQEARQRDFADGWEALEKVAKSEKERKLIKMRWEGYGMSEICEALGMDRHAAQYLLKKLKEKYLREMGAG